ncbi:MAG: hypothetical protein BMS9Abin13_496 [Patescibacteria group bacterium]|nr:MAG: hypothetical protein BMS9Abin13_496 [Patescibacteria group bacterium]
MKTFDEEAAEREFERQMKLLQDDPTEFERQSREKIEKVIQNAPPHLQKRLHGIQFQIDTTLAHYKNPIARMNKMVELFWIKAQKLDDALRGLHPSPKRDEEARVIPFLAKDR